MTIHRHRLTNIQRICRDAACAAWGHDQSSSTDVKLQPCGCKLKVSETKCSRCGRTFGTMSWVHERYDEKVEA